MVFKRRARRSYTQMVTESVYPRGGWTRAFHYVRHRLHRLPDSPHSIARGIFAGVSISFTPFFGLHFIGAALVARLIRGNMLAALLATFVVNPVTLPLVAFISLKLGHLILGTTFDETVHASLLQTIVATGDELKNNFLAIFSDATATWDRTLGFYRGAFLPYLIGGIAPGVVSGLIFYYISEPLIAAYQKRRRRKLKDRFEELKARLVRRSARPPKKP